MSTEPAIAASIPMAMFTAESSIDTAELQADFEQIGKYYGIYKKGATFAVEGAHDDYIPAALKYKISTSLINKQARFLFAEAPDILIESNDSIGVLSETDRLAIFRLTSLVKFSHNRKSLETKNQEYSAAKSHEEPFSFTKVVS